MRIDDTFALDFAYTRKMMAFLLFVSNPDHLLMVGLGGGSLAKFCDRHMPHTRLTVVEISPDVIALSGAFNVPVEERMAIIQADAADYLPMTEGDTDVLMLDGFDTAGIAPSFLNRDLYQAARFRLRPAGLLVASFAGPELGWAAHLSLLNEVFERRVHVQRIPDDDNHITFAFVDDSYPPDWAQLKKCVSACPPNSARLSRVVEPSASRGCKTGDRQSTAWLLHRNVKRRRDAKNPKACERTRRATRRRDRCGDAHPVGRRASLSV